jgi:hypothetical protein
MHALQRTCPDTSPGKRRSTRNTRSMEAPSMARTMDLRIMVRTMAPITDPRTTDRTTARLVTVISTRATVGAAAGAARAALVLAATQTRHIPYVACCWRSRCEAHAGDVEAVVLLLLNDISVHQAQHTLACITTRSPMSIYPSQLSLSMQSRWTITCGHPWRDFGRLTCFACTCGLDPVLPK